MTALTPSAAAPPPWVRVAAPVVVGLAMLGIWVLIVDVLAIAPRALPSPFAVVDQFVTFSGIIIEDMGITATNALVGLLIGTIFAIIAAALAASFRPIDGMLAPLVAAIAVVPIVALTPILNTMFGASNTWCTGGGRWKLPVMGEKSAMLKAKG